MHELEKLCSITLDEMAIEPKLEYEKSSGKIYGSVDLPGHVGKACHALVFMLCGISTRWKQTVAYYMTGMVCEILHGFNTTVTFIDCNTL